MKKILLLVFTFALFSFSTPVQAKTSQQILNESLQKIRSAKTIKFESELTTTKKYITPKKKVKNTPDYLNLSYLEPGDRTSKIKFNGRADFTDEKNPKMKLDVSMDVGDMLAKEAKFSVILFDEIFYIYLNSDGEKSLLNQSDLSFLLDKWIKFDTKSLQKKLNDLGFESKTDATKVEKKINDKKTKDDIVKSFIKNKVFVATRLKDVKNSKGVYDYHFKLILNKKGLQNFTIDASKLIGEPMTAKEKAEMVKEIASMSFPVSNILINKKTGYPSQLTLSSSQKDKYYSSSSKLKITFSSFNESLNLYPPVDNIGIDELFNTLMEQYKKSTSSTLFDFVTSTSST